MWYSHGDPQCNIRETLLLAENCIHKKQFTATHNNIALKTNPLLMQNNEMTITYMIKRCIYVWWGYMNAYIEIFAYPVVYIEDISSSEIILSIFYDWQGNSFAWLSRSRLHLDSRYCVCCTYIWHMSIIFIPTYLVM